MTKFQTGTILTSQVMDCQVHTIGKTIRPFSQIRSHMCCMIMDQFKGVYKVQDGVTCHSTRSCVFKLVMPCQESSHLLSFALIGGGRGGGLSPPPPPSE